MDDAKGIAALYDPCLHLTPPILMKHLLAVIAYMLCAFAFALPGEDPNYEYSYKPTYWRDTGYGLCQGRTPEEALARSTCDDPSKYGCAKKTYANDGWWFTLSMPYDINHCEDAYYNAINLQGVCAPGSEMGWNNDLQPAKLFCRQPKCPAGQFRGPVSNACRTICPDDQYLVKGSGYPGSCKPKPKVGPADDVDPDAGRSCPASGNPINTATGNKFQQEVDSVGTAGIPFVRSFNSMTHATETGMGQGWRHNWSARIVPVYVIPTVLIPPPPSDLDPDYPWPTTDSVAPKLTYYRIERGDGASVSTDLTGVLTDPSNKFSLQIAVNSDGFIVLDGLVIDRFDTSGKLISRQEAGGRTYTLAYNGDNLATVTDTTTGRTLQFSYESASSNRLVRVDAGNQLVASFLYNGQGLLSQVTHADNTSRQYLYDNANAPGKLSGIIDEANNRYVTWAYDTAGRAISSEHAGGVDRYTLNFGSDGTNTSWTDETGPLGATRRFSFQLLNKRYLTTGNSQPATSGCQAGISQYGYDDQGNVTSKKDLAGTVTTYEIEPTRKLEYVRVEAAGTPLARTIFTRWHPVFALPTSFTEPGQTTNLGYDDKGNLTSRTVTDTAAQRSRTWRYGYDGGNRLTSIIAPGSITTSYTYDDQGNLATATDSAGNITRYTRYDANGLPLTIVSPTGAGNTLTTTLEYDLRGRLTKRNAGSEITRYSYTPTGLLSDVSLPTGRSLHYDYDAAYRLVAVTDNQGNSIRYTLDAMGNRTHEEINDASASLRSLIARIDADRNPLPRPTAA